MAVKIRFARIGQKHKPFYRIVAVDSREKRDGAFLDNIGTYDTLTGKIVRFDEACYNKWISQGAQPTDSVKKVHRLFKKSGLKVAPKAPVSSEAQAEATPAE